MSFPQPTFPLMTLPPLQLQVKVTFSIVTFPHIGQDRIVLFYVLKWGKCHVAMECRKRRWGKCQQEKSRSTFKSFRVNRIGFKLICATRKYVNDLAFEIFSHTNWRCTLCYHASSETSKTFLEAGSRVSNEIGIA